MKYKVYDNRVKLLDSYLVPKAKYGRELQSIRNLHPNLPLWDRSEASMRREWAAHSILYGLGIKRSKTKDCDLNFETKWYHNIIYVVVGMVALWVIK